MDDNSPASKAYLKAELKSLELSLVQRMEQGFQRVDERFERIDEQFERMDERFNRVHDDVTRVLDVLVNVDKSQKQKMDNLEARIVHLEQVAA